MGGTLCEGDIVQGGTWCVGGCIVRGGTLCEGVHCVRGHCVCISMHCLQLDALIKYLPGSLYVFVYVYSHCFFMCSEP